MNNLMLNSLGYKVKNRTFGEVSVFFEKNFNGPIPDYQPKEVVYSGAEHKGTPKLPNITILPNLKTKTLEIILGTTFGHQHNQIWQGDTRRFQEIYEFQGYGAMLIKNSETTTLHLMKPGEKVVVGTGDNMTIFNLQTSPLITLDYANPEMNTADKELEKKIGTRMTVLINPSKELTVFELNKAYNQRHKKSQAQLPRITIPTARLGQELYKEIFNQRRSFENIGIKVSTSGNIPKLLEEELSPPLLDLALTQNQTLIQELMMHLDNGIFNKKVYDESGTLMGIAI